MSEKENLMGLGGEKGECNEEGGRTRKLTSMLSDVTVGN